VLARAAEPLATIVRALHARPGATARGIAITPQLATGDDSMCLGV
jgi:hypothetical protein